MIYFQGCVAREKLPKVAMATEEILKQSGIDYRLLDKEGCCGSVLLRTGFHEDALLIMQKTLQDIGEEKVLVSCAGCYRTFCEDYAEVLGVKVDVIHISQLLEDLIREGRLKIEGADVKVTYHDPCHLGRHMDEYQAPRNVLKKTAHLVEMSRNRDLARCCGAGSGVRSAFPEISQEVAKMRLEDAKKTGSKVLVTCCPFCILNLKSAEETAENEITFENDPEDGLEILDISQFLVKRLREDAP